MLLNNFFTIVCTVRFAIFKSIAKISQRYLNLLGKSSFIIFFYKNLKNSSLSMGIYWGHLKMFLKTISTVSKTTISQITSSILGIVSKTMISQIASILCIVMMFSLTHVFLSCNKKNKNKEDRKSKNNNSVDINTDQVYEYENIDRQKDNIGDSGVLFSNVQSGNTKKNLKYSDIKIDTKNADLYGNSNMPAKFSKKYPKYKILFPGCCFEGVCMYPKCEAYNKYVWATMGNCRGYDIVKKHCNNNGVKKYTNIGYSNIKSKSLEYVKKHLSKAFTFDKDISLNKAGFIIANLGEEMRNAKCPLCMHYIEKIRACGFSKAVINVVTKNKNGIASRLFYAINKFGYFIYQKLQPDKINEYRDTKLQICYVK